MTFKVPEKFRFLGQAGDTNGAFMVTLAHNQKVFVIASDGCDWEHVSVSRKDRIPTWDEMCAVKAMFWDDSDCVVQFHPPKSEYVNNHARCLHLWRKVGVEFELPPTLLVGDPVLGLLT